MAHKFDENPEFLATMELLDEQARLENKVQAYTQSFYELMALAATRIAAIYGQEPDVLLENVLLPTHAEIYSTKN